MRHRLVVVLVFIFLLPGCTSIDIEPLAKPVSTHPQTTVFDVPPQGARTVSIGEDLFRITRYNNREESVNFTALTGRPFPAKAIWKGTHIFNDGTSGDLIVYSTPDYYNGHLGVILDSEGRPATMAPVVRVDGVRVGRRFRMNGSALFFFRSQERWGLRYGGIDDGKYIFEIYARDEASTIEILQSIRITEDGFLKGFTIRGVLIRGLEKDRNGLIRFIIENGSEEMSR